MNQYYHRLVLIALCLTIFHQSSCGSGTLTSPDLPEDPQATKEITSKLAESQNLVAVSPSSKNKIIVPKQDDHPTQPDQVLPNNHVSQNKSPSHSPEDRLSYQPNNIPSLIEPSSDSDHLSNNPTVLISLKGLKFQRGGRLCIAVHSSPENFPASHGVVSFCQSIISMIEVPLPSKGTYAITVLHDQDLNHKITTGFFGIPKEGFGFSNNPPIFTGPPHFKKAALYFERAKSISIKMMYFL
ncbi:MAG: DUF2141 domain-containing protein [Proteobacteria bacterium]|nr:DUF2141 domain-containing protein [Pseudomonadota bacterium]